MKTTSTASTNTRNDKTKEEINRLKHYILKCPTNVVDPSSSAIQTCITALNNELKRMDRDEKLRLKFAKEKEEVMNTNDIKYEEDDDVVCVEKMNTDYDGSMCIDTITSTAGSRTGIENNDMVISTDEWQDITSSSTSSPSKDIIAAATTSSTNFINVSPLGISLAQVVISDISNANIFVSSPLAALALAIHASLRSDILGFKCTGIPEEENNNGFAPPIRELPRGKFVPDDWDKFASFQPSSFPLSSSASSKVILRYRKNGTGATILEVTQYYNIEDNNNESSIMAKISFGPAGNGGEQEP